MRVGGRFGNYVGLDNVTAGVNVDVGAVWTPLVCQTALKV
jgi:hypothetical protein